MMDDSGDEERRKAVVKWADALVARLPRVSIGNHGTAAQGFQRMGVSAVRGETLGWSIAARENGVNLLVRVRADDGRDVEVSVYRRLPAGLRKGAGR